MDNYNQAGTVAGDAAQQWNASRQAAGGALIGAGAAQQLNAAKQACLRERLQEANKRADGITSNLSHLLSIVQPPQVLASMGKEAIDTLKDSTLSGDMDDLLRTLLGIENKLARLSSAIAG